MANEALQRALQTVLAELQKADGAALTGAGKSVAEAKPADAHLAEGDGMEACEACADGTCTNPDHMSSEDMEQMAEGY